MQKEPVLQFQREKKKNFNEFSLESKIYHGHPVSKKKKVTFTVLQLKYIPNSAKIDCDIRCRRADKNLGLSPWGGGVFDQKNLKGQRNLLEWGKLGSSFP